MGAITTNPEFLLIDLFCGAGGTSTGAELSGHCKVIAAINHDPLAIKSHAANHDGVLHMEEDILIADTSILTECVKKWQAIYPDAKLILWASLECTNFSNAKGGMARDADSRALANGMFRYLEALSPDYFLIENVREFMSWGELDANGKPISKQEGRDYVRWIKAVQAFGYNHDWRLLNAADFGGVTIRNRYFGAFWKPSQSFAWPSRTHAKRAAKGSMFADELKPWRAVAEVLDFQDLGTSIFDRPKPLVDKTLRRILAGLRKFHSQPLIASYYSGSNGVSSIQQPAGTVTTKDRMSLVLPWIDRNFKSGRSQPVNEPAGALLTVPKINLCSAFLVLSSFNNSPRSLEEPAPVILASRKHINLATAWIDNRTSIQESYRSIQEPSVTVCTNPSIYLMNAFIVNPQYKNNGSPVSAPSPTVIAKQKSYPLSLATSTGHGTPRHVPSENDSEAMCELKAFMRENGIADVFMRMLKVTELKRIQGFPDDYVLCGPVNEQKKFIGNSVETGVVASWLRAIAESNIVHHSTSH